MNVSLFVFDTSNLAAERICKLALNSTIACSQSAINVVVAVIVVVVVVVVVLVVVVFDTSDLPEDTRLDPELYNSSFPTSR